MPGHTSGSRRSIRQVHLWLTSEDYAFIHRLARSRDESVSRLFRRVIGSWRTKALAVAGTALVPEVENNVRSVDAVATPAKKNRGGNDPSGHESTRVRR